MTSIQTKSVNIKNKNEATISFIKESMIQTENILKEKYSSYFSIERETVKNPRITITGFDNFENMEIKDIEMDINKRNFENLQSKCKIVHIFKNSKTKMNNILIETTAEIYKQIVDNKFRVHVGYQNCRAFDDLNLTPCFNCGRFGHSGRNCRNDKICLNYASKHDTVNCTSPEEHNCANCKYSNQQFHTKFNTKHVVNDTGKCEVI